MTPDMTTNRVPYMLLTDEEKEVLSLNRYRIEIYDGELDVWQKTQPSLCVFHNFSVYRVKPKPVVKSTWYNICATPHVSRSPECTSILSGLGYSSLDYAKRMEGPNNKIGILRIDNLNGIITAHIEET